MNGVNRKILVLRTTLSSQQEVERVGILLNSEPLINDWNVDLEDCDKVLRIDCYGLNEVDIVEVLQQAGVNAEELQ